MLVRKRLMTAFFYHFMWQKLLIYSLKKIKHDMTFMKVMCYFLITLGRSCFSIVQKCGGETTIIYKLFFLYTLTH